jgi:hypothetical protein
MNGSGIRVKFRGTEQSDNRRPSGINRLFIAMSMEQDVMGGEPSSLLVVFSDFDSGLHLGAHF